MKLIFAFLRPASILLGIMLLLTGIIYPLLMTLIGQVFFHYSANGSLIIEQGKIKGSELIGQTFTDPKYFWGRPSATTPYPYHAAASSGSNFGPLNPDYLKAVQSRIELLKSADPSNKAPIPIDLVTTSGSGLDPHISIASAEYQIPRVAKARNISVDAVVKIVAEATESPTLGFLGEPRVNVLLLNRSLDSLLQGS